MNVHVLAHSKRVARRQFYVFSSVQQEEEGLKRAGRGTKGREKLEKGRESEEKGRAREEKGRQGEEKEREGEEKGREGEEKGREGEEKEGIGEHYKVLNAVFLVGGDDANKLLVVARIAQLLLLIDLVFIPLRRSEERRCRERVCVPV